MQLFLFFLKGVRKMSVSSSTVRERLRIPNMPTDTEELIKLPEFNMHKAEMINDELIFEAPNYFDEVLKAGFFLLKIPNEIDLTSTDLFVNNFYKEKNGDLHDKYKGYKNIELPGDYQGYFDRPHDQWENFYIEANNWQAYLPTDVAMTGNLMAKLGINIIKNILKKLSIPISDWNKITSGLTNNQGHKMLAFNHFRPEKVMRGTKLHRDSGWVTVLRSTEPGLVAYINNHLYAINPMPNHFIINFGSSFEVLTEALLTPVRANIHGVVKTLKAPHRNAGRTSYVVFLDSDLSGNIYRYENDKAISIQSMKEFAIQEVGRTYDDGDYL